MHELPAANDGQAQTPESEDFNRRENNAFFDNGQQGEQASLLWNHTVARSRPSLQRLESERGHGEADLSEEDPTSSFVGLNALEIAAIANAKKFMSQRVVQKIVNDIWSGHIVFWESLSVHSRKKAHIYNQR